MIKDIPKIGIGTWQVQGQETIDKVIKTALVANYLHIDTAQIYNNEYQIGNALKKYEANREKLYITSKIWLNNYKYHVYDSIKESLKRLKTNYLDLILLHLPTNDHEINAIAYKELMRARKDGLVKNIGVSNFLVNDLKELYKRVHEYPYNNQIIFSPIHQLIDVEEFCKKHKIILTAYSTIRPYYLIDKHDSPWDSNHSVLTIKEKEIIDSLAKSYETTPAKLLLKWALDRGYIIIPKSVTPSRIKDNISVIKINLKKADKELIDKFRGMHDKEFYENVKKWWHEYLASEKEYKKGLLFEKNF